MIFPPYYIIFYLYLLLWQTFTLRHHQKLTKTYFKTMLESSEFDNDNNIYSPWSLEEDSLLYDSYSNGESIENLCVLF